MRNAVIQSSIRGGVGSCRGGTCDERTFRVYDGPRFEKDLVNAWALQMHMPRARHVRAFI